MPDGATPVKTMKRQLTVVLYADAAGYSHLTGADEERTHHQLDAGLNLLADTIVKHGGEKVHEAGDAILAAFQSATAAVNAALEFQRQMAAKNTDIDEAERLEFRIGVNLGEVIRDRGDIYGDGVNLAARIQELAERGGVCISRMVYEQIIGRIDQMFDDLGHRKLKNVSHPVHVYRAHLSDASTGLEGQPYFEFDAKPVDRGTLTTGGCLCGEVRYEIDQPALGTGFCHCRICQKFSGAPVTAFTVFAKKAVRFIRSEPKYYKSSLIYERGFCTNCGSSLTGRYYAPEAPDWIGIKTTSLDNPKDFAPTWHLGTESQLPWLDIQDDLPRLRCEESPDLLRRWKALGIRRPSGWKFFTG